MRPIYICTKVLPEDKRATIFSNSASLLQVHVGVLSQLEAVIADMDGGPFTLRKATTSGSTITDSAMNSVRHV